MFFDWFVSFGPVIWMLSYFDSGKQPLLVNNEWVNDCHKTSYITFFLIHYQQNSIIVIILSYSQLHNITNGAQEVKEKATSKEKDDGQPGRPVHLPVL